MAAESYLNPHSVGLEALRSNNRLPEVFWRSSASVRRFCFRFQLVREENMHEKLYQFALYLLYFLRQIGQAGFCVAIKHSCYRLKKQWVFQPGKAFAFSA